MKWRRELVLAAILLLSGTIGQAATTNRLYLTWNGNPAWDTNVMFHVFSQTNLAIPVSQWPHFTNVDFVTFTNAAKIGESGRVEILTADSFMRYYVVASSNFTGMTDFSSPASVSRVLPGTNLTIGAWQQNDLK